MGWVCRLDARAEKALRRFDHQSRERIRDFIDNRLLALPDPTLLGKPLKGNLSGCYSYRVGDYRLICQVNDKELLILVIYVAHRKDVYKDC